MFWAAAAALIVVAAHAATVPLDAWLPVTIDGSAPGPAFLSPLSRGETWGLRAHSWLAPMLAGVPWPARLGWVPLLLTALSASLISRAIQRVGLPGSASLALALVAAGGPLFWAQATSPLGAAVATALAAALVLAVLPRPALARAASLAATVAGTVVVAWGGAPGPGAVMGSVEELGGIGTGLVATALIGSLSPRLPARDVRSAQASWTLGALGAGLWVLTTPLGAVTQVAVTVPVAWTLAAVGIRRLLAWRERVMDTHAVAWLTIGISAWAGVQAFGRPWTARQEMTVLARHWAHAVAETAADAPLLTDTTSASSLVEAWARGTPALDGRVTLARLPPAPLPGPLTLLPGLADAGRWVGLAPSDGPVPLATLAEVAGGLPPHVVVAVAISRDAASRLTPDAWQALAALGSRVGPGGAPRARAVVGVTGVRAAGSETASSPPSSLTLLPGDLIGQTGRPSPLDLRLEADAEHVRLFERDRLRVAAPGVVLAVYRRTGVRLALWTGADTRSLTAGVPGTDGPVVRHVREVLACREVPADTAADLTDLAVDGALGVQAPPGARIRVSTGWPDDHPPAAPRSVDDPPHPSDADATTLEASAEGRPFGITLRGRPAAVRWQADTAAHVCQAAPIQQAMRPGTAATIDVHPRVEHAFGGGWHDLEPVGGGRYFRWMAGPRAVLLFALAPSSAPAGAVDFTLDAQSVGAPGPDDRLRLAVNGTWLDARTLPPGRGLQTWALPGALLRSGLNEILIDTSLTVRPSDLRDGADGRLLGMAVYGWHFSGDGPDTPQGAAPNAP